LQIFFYQQKISAPFYFFQYFNYAIFLLTNPYKILYNYIITQLNIEVELIV